MISSLFLIEKLMKFVSISTWYGGPSCVLYWKNSADEFCVLWVNKKVIYNKQSLHLFHYSKQYSPASKDLHGHLLMEGDFEEGDFEEGAFSLQFMMWKYW